MSLGGITFLSQQFFNKNKGSALYVGVRDETYTLSRHFGNSTDKSKYEIGPITTVMTAEMGALAEVEGIHGLDHPICKTVYGKSTGTDIDKVTMRHLLTHSSGFKSALPDSIDDMNKLSNYAKCIKLRPGDSYNYSDANYGLATMLLEKAYDKDFPTLMKEKIFDGYGMNNTFVSTDEESRKELIPCTRAGDPIKGRFDNNWYGASHVVSTPEDISKWVFAHYDLQFVGDIRQAAKICSEVQYIGQRETGVGWSFRYISASGRRVMYKPGNTNGFACVAGYNENAAVVVMTNDSASNVTLLMNNIFDLVDSGTLEYKPNLVRKPSDLPPRPPVTIKPKDRNPEPITRNASFTGSRGTDKQNRSNSPRRSKSPGRRSNSPSRRRSSSPFRSGSPLRERASKAVRAVSGAIRSVSPSRRRRK